MMRHRTAYLFILTFLCGAVGGVSAQSSQESSPALSHHPDSAMAKRLEEQTDFDFDQVPLKQVVAKLNASGLPLILDEAQLDLLGIDVSQPVSLKHKRLQFGSALNHMLRPFELTVLPHGNWLKLTTREYAENHMTIANYPVWDLVNTDGTPSNADYESLIDVLVSTIEPNTWREFGGQGAVMGYKGILTVNQSFAAHQKVANLLDTLRLLPATTEANLETRPIARMVNAEWKVQLTQRLGKSTDWDFVDIPLSQVVLDIGTKYELPVQLDTVALDESGMDANTLVTGRLRGAALGDSLRMLLADIELTYLLRDECVVITTLEEAERSLDVRVYPVAGLLDGLGPEKADYDSLVELIVSMIAPESWEEVGGAACVRAYPRRACLVVNQSDGVHKELQGMLDDLYRKYRGINTAQKVLAGIAPGEIVTHIYKIPESTSKDDQTLRPIGNQMLVFLIQANIAKESWNQSDDARIISLNDRLMIRHRHDVHLQIQALLEQLSVKVLNGYSVASQKQNVAGSRGQRERARGGGGGGGGFGGGGFGGGGFGGGGFGGRNRGLEVNRNQRLVD